MNVKAKVNLLNDSTSNVKALASITIEDSFVVTGIRVIESQKGIFFSAMPSRKTPSGEYKDICFPITAEARAKINDEILKEYYKKVGEKEQQSNYVPFADSDVPPFTDDLPF